MVMCNASLTLLGQTINNYRQRTVDELRELIFKGAGVALVAAIIIWVAIFLYVAFYYTYIPSVSHIRPVHLQFRPCEEIDGICSYPSAHVRLTKKQQLLMIGQQYKMYLQLEMPESPANQKLGMFMVCIELHDKDNQLVDNSCRSTMLHYRSYLLHTLTTLIFSPVMMFGNREEKQNIVLELFTDFEEDQNHPVTDIYVEIQSRQVELYSAILYIHAHFTGIRYFMFHWPIFSAAVGITSNLFFIVLVCLLSWWQLHRPNAHKGEYLYSSTKDEDEPQLQQKRRDTSTFSGEPDDSSIDDASLVDDNSTRNGESDDGFLPLPPGGRQHITELPSSR